MSTTVESMASEVPSKVSKGLEWLDHPLGGGLPADFDVSKLGTLGLQIVQIPTVQLGGRLEIQSKRGTRVDIRFPVRVGDLWPAS